MVLFLTLWRASKLTMQEDTGPLPAGQRSMKPVELYIDSTVTNSLGKLITAFELAHGVQVRQITFPITTPSSQDTLELNSSRLFLLKESRKLLLDHLKKTSVETAITPLDKASIEPHQQWVLIHYPLENADPNVMEVVNYLSGTNQAQFLYSDNP